MARRYDVTIIGGGIVGAATASVLAKRGWSVLLLEQNRLGHSTGSSRGGARIWHLAGYPSATYLDHGLKALERWRELERVAGRTLLLETGGGVSYGDGVEGQAELLSAAGREWELRPGKELDGRWPGVSLPRDQPVLYQRDAGVILARESLQALLDAARDAGAELIDQTPALRLIPDGQQVLIAVADDTVVSRYAIVTAGPWSARLLASADIVLDVVVTEQTVAWFEWPHAIPPTIIEFGRPDPFALLEPNLGLKAGLHEAGPVVAEPDSAAGDGGELALSQISAWVADRFPPIDPRPARVETCRYTWTPDESFALELHGPIVVGSACSGQGFQYAPRTAELLADLLAR